MRKLVRKCIENDFVWSWIAKGLVWPANRVLAARKSALERNLASKIGPKPRVLAGPFKGLTYTESTSVGSALYPKLLGTYESELFQVFTDMVKAPGTSP